MLAYRITPQHWGKISPAFWSNVSVWIQHIATHQAASACTADHKQRDHAHTKTATGRALQPHSMATPRSPTIPTTLSTIKSRTSNLAENNIIGIPTKKLLEPIRFRPALQPDTPGTGGPFNQQWSLPIWKPSPPIWILTPVISRPLLPPASSDAQHPLPVHTATPQTVPLWPQWQIHVPKKQIGEMPWTLKTNTMNF